MKRAFVVLTIVLALAVVGGAGYLGARSVQSEVEPASQAPTTTEVTRGDVQQTITAPGRLLNTRQVTLALEVGGKLAEVGVHPGQSVQAGEVLARLDADPLAAQVASAQTALQTSLELAPQDEHVAQAQAQMQRLEALTGGLLDLSRIESEAEGSEMAPVPLKALVEEVSELYASQAEQAGLGFELSLPESPLIVRGDGAQLRQALANLLDNAVKFTPAGGGVCLGLSQEDEMAVLWVEDTGIGIPTDELPHLFRRFYRGRNASSYPGSGLGLAIVKAIAERHGGRVEGESSGSGTRFSLWLPVRVTDLASPD